MSRSKRGKIRRRATAWQTPSTAASEINKAAPASARLAASELRDAPRATGPPRETQQDTPPSATRERPRGLGTQAPRQTRLRPVSVRDKPQRVSTQASED